MKRVLITGASGGMGSSCSEMAAAEGYQLILADMINTGLDKLADRLTARGASVETCVIDITDMESLNHLVSQIEQGGKLDAVIHTVGVSPQMADWEKVIAIDLIGAAHILEKLKPIMNRPGALVFISSMSAHLIPPNPEISGLLKNPLADDLFVQITALSENPLADRGMAYAYSKLALTNYVAANSAELGREGIRIISLSPGLIATDMGLLELENHPMREAMEDRVALNRLGQPEDIANTALFLISDKAAYITGCDILVDGGFVASARKT